MPRDKSDYIMKLIISKNGNAKLEYLARTPCTSPEQTLISPPTKTIQIILNITFLPILYGSFFFAFHITGLHAHLSTIPISYFRYKSISPLRRQLFHTDIE
jgi:hypothetical protein